MTCKGEFPAGLHFLSLLPDSGPTNITVSTSTSLEFYSGWQFWCLGRVGHVSRCNATRRRNYCARGLAGYLLGCVSSQTSAQTVSVLGKEAIPGITIYNFNRCLVESFSDRVFTVRDCMFGQAHWVTVFWVRGILFAFGGDVVDTVTWEDNGSSLKSLRWFPFMNP